MSEQPVQRIRARWVLPLAGDPVENGVVEVAGQQIRQLRPAVAGEPVQDLGDLVLHLLQDNQYRWDWVGLDIVDIS